jgi:hypothetical protein
LTSKRSGSGCRNPLGGRSAGAWRTVREEPNSLSVLREFLRVFRSIHFVGGFFLHEVCGRSVLECRMVRDGADSLRAHCGQSVIEGQYWRFRGYFWTVHRSHADSPPRPRGRSARCLRTVRPDLADGPLGACGRSTWSSVELLSPLLFEFRFCFVIVWGLLLGLVGQL